jgi:hypothetical protein
MERLTKRPRDPWQTPSKAIRLVLGRDDWRAITGDGEAFGIGASRGKGNKPGVSRLPGTFIQNAFLKLYSEYYREIVFEMGAPNAVSRFVLHLLNFLPARIVGLGAPPAPGYNAAMTRTKIMAFGKHEGEFVENLAAATEVHGLIRRTSHDLPTRGVKRHFFLPFSDNQISRSSWVHCQGLTTIRFPIPAA